MLGKYKNIIIVVGIIIIGFVAYSIFKPNPESESLLVTSGTQEIDILGEDMIEALNQIDSLKLDVSVLKDPIIRELKDHSRPIAEEPFGKQNPFGPIGGAGVTEEVTEEAVDTESTTGGN